MNALTHCICARCRQLKRVSDEYPPGKMSRYCSACQAAWLPAPGDWAWWGQRMDALVVEVAGDLVLVELNDLTRHVVPRSNVLLEVVQARAVIAYRYHLDMRRTARAKAIKDGLSCPLELTLAEALSSAGVEYALPKKAHEPVVNPFAKQPAPAPAKPRQLSLW